MTEHWVTLEEVAQHLGVSKETIYNYIKREKDFPAVKIGRQWRFKISQIDKWAFER
jgi:excisionase family DNA binding protein